MLRQTQWVALLLKSSPKSGMCSGWSFSPPVTALLIYSLPRLSKIQQLEGGRVAAKAAVAEREGSCPAAADLTRPMEVALRPRSI